MDATQMSENSSNQELPRLLYTRSRVCIRTSADPRDDIRGFLSIIESATHEHHLSWAPEILIPDLDDEAYVDIASSGDPDTTSFVVAPQSPLPKAKKSFHPSTYAVSVPIHSIYSVLVYPPWIKDRYGSVIVNMIGGESLATFIFQDEDPAVSAMKSKRLSSASATAQNEGGPPVWGGQELIQHLEELVHLVGSAVEPGVYLVNPCTDDIRNHSAASPRPKTSFEQAPSHPLQRHDHHQHHSNQENQNYSKGTEERLYPKLDLTEPGDNITNPTQSGIHSQLTNTSTGSISAEGMRHRRPVASDIASPSPTPAYRYPGSPNFASSSRSSSGSPRPFELNAEPLVNTVKEIRWNILERFSQVARFSRDTAKEILDHPITKQILPPHVQNNIRESEAARRMMDDYDSARVYLAKWAATVADQGDQERRQQKGKNLPSQHGRIGSSSSGGVRRISDVEDEEGPLGAFNVLEIDMDSLSIMHTRTEPVSPMEWFSFFDDQGKLQVPEAKVREAVFRGGIDHDIRIEAWKFFLGIYPWNSTEVERVAIRASKVEEYYNLKRQWFDHAAVQETEEFQEQRLRIEKDVHRTDRTISFFASETLPNPSGDSTGVGSNENLELLNDILLTYNVYSSSAAARPDSKGYTTTTALTNQLEGYVQGMSDLLAPVFAVMGDEVMGFWAFVGLMERMKRNFYRDQIGMQSQLETVGKLIQTLDPKLYKHLEKCEALNLFFCFRWLLIWFKREFEWVDILKLWEVLFSDHLTFQFHLFVAVAILDKHRDVMMDHLKEFDEILKYVNDLSMTIRLEETLQTAEILFRRLEKIQDKLKARSDESIASSSQAEDVDEPLPESKTAQNTPESGSSLVVHDTTLEMEPLTSINQKSAISQPATKPALPQCLTNLLDPNFRP